MTATKPARLPQLLSIRQVADYLGVSTRTIRRLEAANRSRRNGRHSGVFCRIDIFRAGSRVS